MKTIYKQLSDYIKYERRMTFVAAAKSIDISTRNLFNILSGRPPGKRTAFKIQKWSKGKFKASKLAGY